MSIEVPRETEASLNETRRHDISLDALLEWLISLRCATARVACATPKLPIWHLGRVGPFYRREVYDAIC